MSEKPFFTAKRATAAAAGLLAATTVVAIGQNANRDDHINDRVEAGETQQANIEAYQDSIKAAVEAAYDRKDVVDEIDVVYGTRPIDEAERILKEKLGEEVYNENRGHLYDYLQDSAQLYTSEGGPQPGTKLYVVEVEMDQDESNGKEYIVTNGSGGIIEESTNNTIPSPETH